MRTPDGNFIIGLSTVNNNAQTIADYYLERHGQPSWFIPYGAATGPVETREALDRCGIEPGGYWLYVSRLEPENNALLVVRAFERTAVRRKLVVVGDAPYAQEYIRQVRATRDPRVVFTGYVYGAGYHELQANSFAYVHATEVGGTHPALIEAMGRGRCVLYLDNPENREVAGAVGIPFPNDEAALAGEIERVEGMAEEERAALGRRARERVRERYDWERVTDRYEELLRQCLGRGV